MITISRYARYAAFVLSLLLRPLSSFSAAIALAAVTPLGTPPLLMSVFPVINLISSIFCCSMLWVSPPMLLTTICRSVSSPSIPFVCTIGFDQSANSSSFTPPSFRMKYLGVADIDACLTIAWLSVSISDCVSLAISIYPYPAGLPSTGYSASSTNG